MTKTVSNLHDQQTLEQAFAQFNAVSGQLIDAYNQLQGQVNVLNAQLDEANNELRRQLSNNAALAERLGMLLEALPAGVVELLVDGRVQTENSAAEAMLGASVRGRSWPEVLAGFQPTDIDNTFLLPRCGEQPPRRITLQYQDLPELGGQIVLLHDVTHLHQLSSELAQQQKLASMGSMAASLAHQLRTPLATAMLYTANLRQPSLGEAERERFIDKSLARLKALEGLIQNMLSFVRGQVSELELLDVAGLLEEVRAVVQPHYAARAVRLDCDFALGEPVRVAGDRKALLGILVNLLENALHFSVEGQCVELGARLEGGAVRLCVVDEGPGLGDELLERVFEPFFTTRSGGTGLGLAIVKKVVEELHGSVCAGNREGGGACFEVRLPLA